MVRPGREPPLPFFVGVWTGWTCIRKVAEGEVACELFAFLTTDANAEVRALHPKAMPVVLTEPDEVDAWLAAPWGEACASQRPLPDGALRVVAQGEKEDGVGPMAPPMPTCGKLIGRQGRPGVG